MTRRVGWVNDELGWVGRSRGKGGGGWGEEYVLENGLRLA
jgi:hypothetical protein